MGRSTWKNHVLTHISLQIIAKEIDSHIQDMSWGLHSFQLHLIYCCFYSFLLVFSSIDSFYFPIQRIRKSKHEVINDQKAGPQSQNFQCTENPTANKVQNVDAP